MASREEQRGPARNRQARWDHYGLFGGLAVVFVVLALLAAGCASAPPHPPFLDNYSAAQQAAQSQSRRKPIFVDAWAPWCHTCLSMRAYVLSDPRLRPYYERFVWVAVDVEQERNAPFLAKYPVSSLPTFLVIDPVTGQVARRWLGAMTYDELVQFLEPTKGSARWAEVIGALDAMSRAADDAATRSCLDLAERELPWASAHPSPMAGDFVAYTEECAARFEKNDAERVRTLRVGLAAHLVKLIDDQSAPLSADDRGDALGLLRGLYATLGDKTQAEAIALRRQQLLDAAAARATDPVTQSTYDWARAETYLWLGQGDQAIAMLKAREQQLPRDYNAAHRLGRVYLELNRAQDAIAACDRALPKAYGPRRVEILGLRADAFAKEGDRRAALAAAQHAADELAKLPQAQQKPRLLRATAARVKRLQTGTDTGQ